MKNSITEQSEKLEESSRETDPDQKQSAVSFWRDSIQSNLRRLSSAFCGPPSKMASQDTVVVLEPSDDKIEWMLSQLSDEEVETAARTSYVYLKNPKPEESDDYAKLMCQRYLRSKRGDEQVALKKMKSTLKFRQSMQVEELMTAFDKEKRDDPANDDENGSVATELQASLASKHTSVRGYDKEGRSTFVFLTRRVVSHDPEWSLKEALYTIERAIASSKADDFRPFLPLSISKTFRSRKHHLWTLERHS